MQRRNFLKYSTLLAGAAWAGPHAAYARATGCALPLTDGQLLALGSNENPYGPGPLAIQAMQEAVKLGNRYTETTDLRQKLAQKWGIAPEGIILGAGSAEILGLISLAYCHGQPDTLVAPRPTFFCLPSMFERLGGTVVHVPLTADKKHDLERMAAALTLNTKMVYVCNPNNPTGTKLDPARLRAFVEEMAKKYIVAVDEVYHDFITDPSLISVAHQTPNVIVARSFSKIYGLAGMRVGYGVAHPDTINHLAKYVAWYGNAISQVSKAGALASLQDPEFVKTSLAKNEEAKTVLYNFLKQEGIEHYYSYANCSYFSLEKLPKDFVKLMLDRKIVVRQVDDHGKLYCRVSTGKPEEMQQFINAIRAL
jgi:histidinol-phosphate aminotransferase